MFISAGRRLRPEKCNAWSFFEILDSVDCHLGENLRCHFIATQIWKPLITSSCLIDLSWLRGLIKVQQKYNSSLCFLIRARSDLSSSEKVKRFSPKVKLVILNPIQHPRSFLKLRNTEVGKYFEGRQSPGNTRGAAGMGSILGITTLALGHHCSSSPLKLSFSLRPKSNKTNKEIEGKNGAHRWERKQSDKWFIGAERSEKMVL